MCAKGDPLETQEAPILQTIVSSKGAFFILSCDFIKKEKKSTTFIANATKRNILFYKNNLIPIKVKGYFSLKILSYFLCISDKNLSIESALSNNFLSISFCSFK